VVHTVTRKGVDKEAFTLGVMTARSSQQWLLDYYTIILSAANERPRCCDPTHNMEHQMKEKQKAAIIYHT